MLDVVSKKQTHGLNYLMFIHVFFSHGPLVFVTTVEAATSDWKDLPGQYRDGSLGRCEHFGQLASLGADTLSLKDHCFLAGYMSEHLNRIYNWIQTKWNMGSVFSGLVCVCLLVAAPLNIIFRVFALWFVFPGSRNPLSLKSHLLLKLLPFFQWHGTLHIICFLGFHGDFLKGTAKK